MKRLFILCILMLSLVSCSVDDNRIEFYTEYVPIESVDIPAEFVRGEVYPIYLTYLRPSGCHLFYDFYYASESNQRTVAVINTVYPNAECETLDNEEIEVHFDFRASEIGSYVFRFWQGKDENGNDIYYIVEVPVVD